MKTFVKIIKWLAATVASLSMYLIGIATYELYVESVKTDGYFSFTTLSFLIIATIIITAPVLNHWEAKFQKWFKVKE